MMNGSLTLISTSVAVKLTTMTSRWRHKTVSSMTLHRWAQWLTAQWRFISLQAYHYSVFQQKLSQRSR